MLFFNSTSLFHYSWEDVTKANWQKYPNDITKHVESVDVLHREIDPITGVLRTERLIGCRQRVPFWLTKLMGSSGQAFVREVSEVDPKTGSLVLRSQNLDFSTILSVTELVRYERDSQNPDSRTSFIQQATFNSGLSLQRLCNKIEEYAMSKFAQNAQLGRAAFEQVLSRLSDANDEGNNTYKYDRTSNVV